MNAFTHALRAALADAETRAIAAPGWHARNAASRAAVVLTRMIELQAEAEERDADDDASDAHAARQANLRLLGRRIGAEAAP